MFSRFKKDAGPARPAAPAAAGAAAPAAAAARPAAAGVVTARPSAPSMPARSPAEAVAADKEAKRKQRLMELKLELHKRLLENLNLSALEHASEQSLKAEISNLAGEALDEMSVALNKDDRTLLVQELYDEVMGLGPLEPLLKDETVNDILVNGPVQRVFVERAGKLTLTDITFKDERHLLRIIDKIVSAVGRRVDESNPYCDARLADGSRFNCMVPPVAVDGSLVSIRKFKKEKLKHRGPGEVRRLHRGNGRLSSGRRVLTG
jgi:pilus assembly protein CpaF